MDISSGQAKKDSQVQLELKRLNNAAEVIMKRVIALEERLSAVLLQSFPVPEGMKAYKPEEQQEKVPLGCEIEAITETLLSVNRKIDSINERLEL